MIACTVGSSVSNCEKVTLIHICEPKKNLVTKGDIGNQYLEQIK